MNCLDRVLKALSRVRDHLVSLVNESEVTKLKEQLAASQAEKEEITKAVEAFADEVVPAPAEPPADPPADPPAEDAAPEETAGA